MSTGDVRRPNSKLSTKAAADEKPEADVVDDAPKGGVLPAKKASAQKAAAQKATAQKATAQKATGAKTATKTAAKSAGTRPAGAGQKGRPGAGGGKGRKPVVPVKVAQGRNWGPIAISIIGFGAWKVYEKDHQPPWQERAASIEGIHNYLETNKDWFVYDPNVGNHKAGVLTYPIYPPVGGVHNGQWQNCMGDVYPAAIPKEQATHSLEHGAVWIAYRPDLPADQVEKLASKVRNVEFTLMSPYPGLDAPISLQAWGYQLKLDNANDGRIDDFINALRKNTSQEPQAGCSGGITDTGDVPLDLAPIGG
jgi:Protein of unknown function (DUF3105)